MMSRMEPTLDGFAKFSRNLEISTFTFQARFQTVLSGNEKLQISRFLENFAKPSKVGSILEIILEIFFDIF